MVPTVRGPAGAAWGANAFTGVINIITKDPEDCLGWFAATTWNHVGDSHNHVRWAAKADKWSWRMSVGYAHQKSSEDAVADDHFISRDFSRDWRFDAKAIYRSSDWTKWSFGGAYSQIEAGDYEFQTLWRGKDSYFRTARSFLKVDHSFRGGATGYLQFFNNYEKTHDQSIMQEWTAQENDIEGQLNFKPGQKHKMSIGGNLRWTHINTHSPRVQDFVLVGEPFNEYWGGVFVTDRWEATDRLALEGQLRGDCYSGTHPDWSGRLTGLYALDAKKRHVCRLSTAKAFRAPQTGLRKVSVARMPHPMVPGTFLLNLLPNENLDNEQTWSLEAGYTGRLTQHLTVTDNGYFQRFDELISVVDLPDPMAIGRRFKRLTENDESAKAWGGEFELALKGKPGKLSAWYAYNAFQEDTGHQTVRAYQPANHKAGLTGRLFLPGGWALNANYSYSDTTPYDPIGNAGADARAAHRLDLAVAKEFAKGQAEVAVGVTDVLNRTDDAAYDRGAVTAHDTLGRTFFVRLQVKF